MDKEKQLKEAERTMIMSGILAMRFPFAYKNPETGKISFYEEPPEIKGDDIIWKGESKDFYGKADHIFTEDDFDENNVCSLGAKLLFGVIDSLLEKKGSDD